MKHLILLLLFCCPATAGAQLVLEVDSWSDGADINPGNGVCLSINGVCSFRAAIEEANAYANSGGPDIIQFTNIPILAWFAMIEIKNVPLPSITDPVVIDATTAAGDVIIEGGQIASIPSAKGLWLGFGANGNTVRGLSIINFSGTGLLIQSDHNKIESNHIGVLSDGSDDGNASYGIYVQDGNYNVIGDAGVGNVIGSNGSNGVYISQGNNNKVRANYIGTNAAGQNRGNAGSGIMVSSAERNIIGGFQPEYGNIIGFNETIGIQLGYGSENKVRNNYVGTDAAGNNLGNGSYGILVIGEEGSLVGGISDYGNVVGWNAQGVVVSFASGNEIQGNYIGVTRDGLSVANFGAGIRISGVEMYTNKVGHGKNATLTLETRKGNHIAYNAGPGIVVENAYYIDESPVQNVMRGNTIYENAGPGIDLGDDNPTANDPLDDDDGANRLMNYPDVIRVDYNGGFEVIAVEYTISSDSILVNYPLTVDVYIADNVASGQGKIYIGSDLYETQDAVALFDVDANSITWASSDVLVFTATDADGNTSEFSPPSEEIGGPGSMAATVTFDSLAPVVQTQSASEPVISAPYPNPFNPQTTFTINLIEPTHARVTIHDALGRQVVQLYDGKLDAGRTHTFTFDGAGLASGVYLLRVAGNHFVETRRLMLVK